MADTSITREERYLEYLTGNHKGNVPKPVTRRERYLYELCLKGMGGEISPEEIKNAVNEYLEKNPVKPGATIEEAQQIEQNKTDIASLKTETNSLKESISNKITKFYASSQGETHLADSDNGKIMDMMLYGKSEQKQYSGKNLLNATLQTTTKNGVTCTNNGDGTFTLNGTASENALFLAGVINIESKGEYKKVGCPLKGSTETYWLGGASLPSDIGNGSKGILQSGTQLEIIIAIYSGYTCNNLLFKPMIVDAEKYPDATYDDFEPYTGGQPSPSPDYPQEIKSVVNPTVKVRGKNLLNYDEWKDTPIIRGTAIYENNGITLTATKKDCYSEMGKFFPDNAKIKVSEGETLTLSWEEIEKKEGNIYIFGNGIASNGVSTDNRKSKKLSYTVPSGVTFITFRFGVTNAGDTISYKNIQIEKGSTPTAYEPYHEQTVTLPYTLNAIPVSSDGNVTIDGQQYIADYVDVKRGKLVGMVLKRVFNGTEKWRMTNSEKYNYFALTTSDDSKLQSILPNNKNIRCNLFKAGELNENNILRLGDYERVQIRCDSANTVEEFKNMLSAQNAVCYFILKTPSEIDLTSEEIAAFKALATYYPTTNISINSEQLDGYTVFNYPISLANGWNYVKQQIGDTRDYIYDMDARTQDTDLQAAEAYVNSEYAVALTELEV